MPIRLVVARERRGLLSCLVSIASALGAPGARADIASDYAAIRGALSSVNGPAGTPTDTLVFGASAFPLLLNAHGTRLGAAGLHGDAAAGARAAILANDGFADTSDPSRAELLENLVSWAGGGDQPLIGVAPGWELDSLRQHFGALGFPMREIAEDASDLREGGISVEVYFATRVTPAALANVQAYAASGGGLVIAALPWALDAAEFAATQTALTPFGIGFHREYAPAAGVIDMPFDPPSRLHNARVAADALARDRAGSAPLPAADTQLASASLDKVYAVRGDLSALNGLVEPLSSSYGWSTPTSSQPLRRAQAPVRAMLARYQWRTKFSALPAAQLGSLFPGGVHPGASDWPGLPAAGSTVTRTISVSGETSRDHYMNQGDKPTRVETGLYAAPGATVTITLPADKAGAGLQVHIGGSEDDCFNLAEWRNFPIIWRRDPLTAATNRVGHVFGGLITLLVPASATLGSFDVVIAGAREAPAFVLGQHTDAQWNASLKLNPGAWGYLKTEKLTLYLPRAQLMELPNPTRVASYWNTVMFLSDFVYGYEGYRKRGEVISANRQVSAGIAYAGYPIETNWGASPNPIAGTDGEAFLNYASIHGEWGAYHELGHGFQDAFDDQFTIATHAEIDVNLNPAMLYTVLHQRSPWDTVGNGTYDAPVRIAKRAEFFGLPAAQQTWTAANGPDGVAYDFYNNLAEAFGWGAYRTAFLRLMRYLQSPDRSVQDPALFAIDAEAVDGNALRDRFFVLLCDATQRDLTAYFARYGIESGAAQHGLTPAAVASVQSKGYAVWNGNLPPTAISNPGALNVAENAAPGAGLAQILVTDPDPYEGFHFEITAGNSDGAFAIDKTTGWLRVSPRGLDRERRASYTLTVRASQNGIPFGATAQPALTSSFDVQVSNIVEAPAPAPKLFTASRSQAVNALLGTADAALEAGRSIRSWAITGGSGAGAFSIDDGGVVRLVAPASLPNPGVLQLTLRATDDAGASGEGTIKVLCNSARGLSEQRWSGQGVFRGTPAFTGSVASFDAPRNVGNNYSRKLSGYIVPEASGVYTFFIASDNQGKLWLSSDADPANRNLIASLQPFTSPLSWHQDRTQRSAPVELRAGQAYYVEATHIDATLGDHLSVGWLAPGASAIAIVPGSVLIPYRTGIAF